MWLSRASPTHGVWARQPDDILRLYIGNSKVFFKPNTTGTRSCLGADVSDDTDSELRPTHWLARTWNCFRWYASGPTRSFGGTSGAWRRTPMSYICLGTFGIMSFDETRLLSLSPHQPADHRRLANAMSSMFRRLWLIGHSSRCNITWINQHSKFPSAKLLLIPHLANDNAISFTRLSADRCLSMFLPLPKTQPLLRPGQREQQFQIPDRSCQFPPQGKCPQHGQMPPREQSRPFYLRKDGEVQELRRGVTNCRDWWLRDWAHVGMVSVKTITCLLNMENEQHTPSYR